VIEIFSNKTEKVGSDLKKTVRSNSKVEIVAGIFLIYGYFSLKRT